MDRLASSGILVSRILLAAIFLVSGVEKLFAFGPTMGAMAARGMHMPGLFLVLAVLVEISGGLSVLVGYYPRLGALALALYLVPVTLVFHRALGDPDQAAHFAKNVAIIGGLLAIVSVGGGEFTVERKKTRE